MRENSCRYKIFQKAIMILVSFCFISIAFLTLCNNTVLASEYEIYSRTDIQLNATAKGSYTSFTNFESTLTNTTISTIAETSGDSETEVKYKYLSDLEYITDLSYVGWGSITMDAPPEGSTITLIVDGEKRPYLKGIGLHANGQIVFDISELSGTYTRFVSKAGVDASRGSAGNGVRFGVYVSNDAENWTTLIPYITAPVQMGNSEAMDIDVDVAGYKYLKILVNHNGSNASDHGVLGGAKLVTADYSEEAETYNKVHKLEYYDNILGNNDIDYNYKNNYRLILEREFVNKIGYYTITELANFDTKYRDTIDWLLSTNNNLEQTIEVGEISDTVEFIKIVADLYYEYKDELDTEDGDVYTKMIIAMGAAYTTDNISSGLTFSHYSANFDYMERFAIIKSLYDEKASKYYTREYFGSYHIELIRTIMVDGARNDEVRWLNYYTISKNYNVSVYAYVNHTGSSVSYNDDALYTDQETYDSKYHLTEYGVPFGDTTSSGTRIQRQWMVIEKGGICWNQSRVFTSLCKSNGRPVIGSYQPGHEAAFYYIPNTDEEGNPDGTGTWNIANNIFGWGKSGTKWYGGNRYRTIFNWANKSFTDQIINASNTGNATAYIYLAQANLNRYADYKESLYLNLLANSYSDYNDKVTVYDKALEVCEINLDSYDYKIQSYEALNKDSSEWYELALDIINNYTYYPMAMDDLLDVIRPYLNTNHLIDIDQREYAALQLAKVATSSDVYIPTAAQQIASVLLGNMDAELATFSFDGTNAGTIVISSEYDGRDIAWHYSIDGGNTLSESITDHSFTLSATELDSITVENDIKIYIDGVSLETPMYTIDIKESTGIPSTIYANDLENKLIAAVSTMEWKYNEDDEWTSYGDEEPDLTGDTTVIVRMGATDVYVAGESVEYQFTEDNQPDTEKYVKIEHLSIEDFSSTTEGRGEPATNAIDGNANTMWHTNRTTTTMNDPRWIIIKLDEPKYISKVQYVKKSDYSYGILKDGIISVSMDGETWEEVVVISDLYNPTNANELKNSEDVKDILFGTSKEAQYIKIELTTSCDYVNGSKDGVPYDYFFSAAMINLFEDTTKKEELRAEITYSTTELTNQDVVATITFNKENVTVIGGDTHTFTANGEYTFEFVDEDGNEGTATATVDWIDKKVPVAEITYSTTEETTQDVIATITFNEENVTVTGGNTHIFTANGEYTFEFADKAGNKGTATAKVDWIKENQETSSEYMLGDANEDGKITATDLLLVKRHLVAGSKQEWILTKNRFKAGDINEDGKITATDLILIKRLILKQMET